MKHVKIILGTISLTIGLTATGHSQSFLTDGLVAFYPFDGDVNDASGNGNNGSLMGVDWKFTTDRFGNPQGALFLNTTSSPSATLDGAYVSAPRSAALEFSGNFTLSVWVNYSVGAGGSQQQTLISNGSDGYGYMDFAVDPAASDIGGNDRLAFSWGGANAANGVMAPRLHTWRQVVARHSGTNMTVFENGVALSNSVSTVSPLNSPTIWFGRFQPIPSGNQNTLQLFGGLDDVRLYNRALSDAEIQQLYVVESGPRIELVKAVKPAFSNLTLGTNYQLQVSVDLNNWTNTGPVFTATNSSMLYPQYFDVANWHDLFFRLQSTP